jgi:cyclopropane fatty-acyl-phospholipid synthase-like methyltransferase
VKKADWSRYLGGLAALLKPGGYFHLTAFSTRFKHYPGERRSRNWVVHRITTTTSFARPTSPGSSGRRSRS